MSNFYVLNDIPEETGKNDVVVYIFGTNNGFHKKRVVDNCDYPYVRNSVKSELIWVFAFC
jgi:hypothetical protein